MENERIQKEIEETDLIDLITPNEVFDTIQMYDSTIEVIGYVDSIEPLQSVEIDKKNELFKFYLNNGHGKRVPVIAKNDNIGDNLRCMTLNSIVHLDGVQTMPTAECYNIGTVPYQLIIRKNTVFSNLGNYELTKSIPVKLCQVLNTSGCIMLKGYVKSNFMEFHDKLNKLIGCGSITDGTYKLEIHIKDFSYTDYLKHGIEKGDKIKVIGTIQTDNPIYLLVNNISNIEKLEGHMSFSAMLKGICALKRETCKEILQEDETI